MLRPHRLSLAVLAALVVPTAAFAQQAPTDAQARTSTLDTLIVTGTRVADRTVAESQSPIDIITPETLETTGTTELATALARASGHRSARGRPVTTRSPGETSGATRESEARSSAP